MNAGEWIALAGLGLTVLGGSIGSAVWLKSELTMLRHSINVQNGRVGKLESRCDSSDMAMVEFYKSPPWIEAITDIAQDVEVIRSDALATKVELRDLRSFIDKMLSGYVVRLDRVAPPPPDDGGPLA